jgi:hypothetical protein
MVSLRTKVNITKVVHNTIIYHKIYQPTYIVSYYKKLFIRLLVKTIICIKKVQLLLFIPSNTNINLFPKGFSCKVNVKDGAFSLKTYPC